MTFESFELCVYNHKAEFSGPLWAAQEEAPPKYWAIYLGCCFEVTVTKIKSHRLPPFPSHVSLVGVQN